MFLLSYGLYRLFIVYFLGLVQSEVNVCSCYRVSYCHVSSFLSQVFLSKHGLGGPRILFQHSREDICFKKLSRVGVLGIGIWHPFTAVQGVEQL